MAYVALRAGRRDHDAVNSYIAHLRGVRKAVADEGREIQQRAQALFKMHDHPGGHRIVGVKADTDYHVILEGPAPLSVEFGREAFTRADGVHVGAMQGLHILGRAAGL